MDETVPATASGRTTRRIRTSTSLWAVLATVAVALAVAAVAVLVATDGLAGLRTDDAGQPVANTSAQ